MNRNKRLRFLQFTCFTGMCCVVFLALGTWQLHRLKWKESLITNMKTEMRQPPLPLDMQTETTLRSLTEYRHVTFSATFPTEECPFFLTPRYRGETAGAEVISRVFTHGMPLFVNLGWVKTSRANCETYRSFIRGNTPLTLTGYVRQHFKKPWFSLSTHVPEAHSLFWVDMPALQRVAPEGTLPLVILNTADTGYTAPHTFQLELPNDHFSYAVTWYALAAVTAIMYVLYTRKHGKTGS